MSNKRRPHQTSSSLFAIFAVDPFKSPQAHNGAFTRSERLDKFKLVIGERFFFSFNLNNASDFSALSSGFKWIFWSSARIDNAQCSFRYNETKSISCQVRTNYY